MLDESAVQMMEEGKGEQTEVELDMMEDDRGTQAKRSAAMALIGVNFVVKTRKGQEKSLLKDIDAEFSTGECVAIIGPSGAGKTTLLSVLSGSYKPSKGSFLLNNKKATRKLLREKVVLVPQDDLLLATSTVEEALMESVQFHDIEGESLEVKKAKVDSTLRKFGLGSCRDVLIGGPGSKKGCSGGQRKRVAIAVEMIGNPTFCILDEPTSGLDSSASKLVVNMLRKTSREESCGVICTIHQPSSSIFFTFDKLLLIVDGRLAYFGSTANVVSYFTNIGFNCPEFHNPADYLMDLVTLDEEGDVSKDQQRIQQILDHKTVSDEQEGSFANLAEVEKGDRIKKRTESTSENSTTGDLDEREPNIAMSKQVGILLKRNFRHMLREPALARARLVSHTVIGIVIGALYFDLPSTPASIPDRIALNMFSIVFLTLSCALPVVVTFLPEREVMLREHKNRWYSALSFFLAKGVSDLPFLIIPTLIFTTIVYFMSNFDSGTPWRFWAYALSMMMHVLAIHAWATFLATVAPNLPVAVFLTPITVMPSILFMGFFLNVDKITWVFRWYSYFPNYFTYTWNALNTAAFYDYKEVGGDAALQLRLQISADTFGYYWVNIIILAAFIVGIRVLAYFSLWYFHTSR